jgi:hypothetical protein
MSYENLPLIVAQNEVRDKPGAMHWALVAFDLPSFTAHIFQIGGNPDTFHFYPRVVRDINDTSRFYCGGIEVGYVPRDQLENLEKWLSQIPIYRNNPAWHCQTWVLDSLRKIQLDKPPYAVLFPDHASNRRITKELKMEEKREQAGEDLIDDRLRARYGISKN